MQDFVAFDIEVSTPPKGADWRSCRPLGISCAATLNSQTGVMQLWHGAEQDDGRLAERMTPRECEGLVEYLIDAARWDKPTVTWNGLGFDFDILQEETSAISRDLVHVLAYYDHIDIGFQMLCQLGFMCGLSATAKGMGLAGKLAGMSGAQAPVLWAGSRDDQNRVLEYVAQDVRTTAEIYRAACSGDHVLRWVSRSNRLRSWAPRLDSEGERLLTVSECLALPEPETTLSNPWPRSKFADWLKLSEMPGGAP